jgi:hypothetical protein
MGDIMLKGKTVINWQEAPYILRGEVSTNDEYKFKTIRVEAGSDCIDAYINIDSHSDDYILVKNKIISFSDCLIQINPVPVYAYTYGEILGVKPTQDGKYLFVVTQNRILVFSLEYTTKQLLDNDNDLKPIKQIEIECSFIEQLGYDEELNTISIKTNNSIITEVLNES